MADSVSVLDRISFPNMSKMYETSSGRSHRFIPNIPQDFDCRVKASIKQETLYKDCAVKNEEFKTTYNHHFPPNMIIPEVGDRPCRYTHVHYLRNVEEKLRIDSPPPMDQPLSEMKNSFRTHYVTQCFPEATAPIEEAKCPISRLGCEQQPAIHPHKKGYWKLTDPYLTNYKSQYVIYDDADDKIKGKILTIYNRSEFNLPPASGNKTMFDKSIFSNVLPLRLMSRRQNRVPYFGMESEYQNNFIRQTFSQLYPYLQDRCTVLDDSLPPASSWQTLVPPGMYCSEYCNIGGKSVRRVVDQEKPKKDIKRTENCCKI